MSVMSTQPPFGIYAHVPFCAAGCGCREFDTYTPSELAGSGASPGDPHPPGGSAGMTPPHPSGS